MLRKIAISLVITILFSLIPSSVSAQAPGRSDKQVIVPQNEVINRDYFVSGDYVEINGTINGDLYAAGNEIVLNGTVNGDVLAAGNSLTLNGTVAEDARIAGRVIKVSGRIGGNITAAASDIDLLNSSNLGGSLVVGATNLTVASLIPGNITGGVQTLTITAPVEGDVDVAVQNLTLTPDADIQGNLTYLSDKDASISPEASVGGTVTRREPPEGFKATDWDQARRAAAEFFRTLRYVTSILSFLSLLVIGLLLARFFPNLTANSVNTLERSPGRSFLIGLAILIITPILALLLFLSVIGVPLGFFLTFLYIVLLSLAYLPIAIWVGRRIFDLFGRTGSPYTHLVIGLLLLALLSFIPIFGGVLKFVAIMLGLGAYALASSRSLQEARTKAVI